MATTGLFSVKEGANYYTLEFRDLGWMAADLVQYLDDLLKSRRRQAEILKLLGMTMRISPQEPPRAGTHWVVVHLNERRVQTNSEMIRLAVEQQPPPEESPYSPLALRRIYEVLDRYDFTVEFYQ